MAVPKYERDDDELKPFEQNISLYVSWASWALVAISLFFMYMFTDNRSNRGQIQFGYYLFDSIVFGLIGLYFYFLYVRLKYHNPNTMELKIISLFACVASLAKLVFIVISKLIPNIGNIWADIHSLSEVAVWATLTVFFFCYWRRMCSYDFEGEIDDDYLDEGI